MTALALARPLEVPKRPLRTLVLNADCRPLSTWPLSLISAQDAVHAVYRDRVSVLETWDQVFRSPSTTIHVPKVVALKDYAPVSGNPKFCRRSILLRDHYRCQYCGEQFPSHDLTFDHYIPRAKGGKTVWENILTACVECNSLKGDKHLKPRKLPHRPSHSELLVAGLQFLPADIKMDFGSYLYWGATLEA